MGYTDRHGPIVLSDSQYLPLFSQQNLTMYIEGATAGVLAGDSSNIVSLVKENYAVSIALHFGRLPNVTHTITAKLC